MARTFIRSAGILMVLAASVAGAATLTRIDAAPPVGDEWPPLQRSASPLAAPPPQTWLEPAGATRVTEIPEPASLALVVTGLFGLAVLGRKRHL